MGVTNGESLKFQSEASVKGLVSDYQGIVSVLHMIAKHDMISGSVLGESHIVEVVSRPATRAMGFATRI